VRHDDERLQQLWLDASRCRRCTTDPRLGQVLTSDTYVAFPTVGVLPRTARSVAYIVVAAEPNSAWVRNRKHAEERIRLGLRNLADGPENVSLQYAIEEFLLRPGEGYYLTDMAKCTVPINVAGRTRRTRYELCLTFFRRELDLLKPRAILTVGLDAYRFLKTVRLPEWPPVMSLLHFAGTAARARTALLDPNWRKQAPELATLEAFALSRRLALHAEKPTGIRPHHLKLVAAYHAQLDTIRQILAGEKTSRHQSGVHVAGLASR